jgi:hypothetical protein
LRPWTTFSAALFLPTAAEKTMQAAFYAEAALCKEIDQHFSYNVVIAFFSHLCL